jgi:phosphatidylglycerophosphatase A
VTASPDEAPRLVPRHWRDPGVLLATGFGSGFLKPGPGTWGSLVAVGLWWALLSGLPWHVQAVVVVVAFVGGIALADDLARRYGVHDDPAIVIDEFAGQWLALLAVPPHALAVVCAFGLFRLLDIAKPGPVGWGERRPGGLGVMLDDLIAGGLVAAVLHLAFLAIGWPGNGSAP